MTEPKQVKGTRTAKAKIPKALREQVWRNWVGEQYSAKCLITWCTNTITVFDFEVGHNIPESKGGSLDTNNLRPICGRCNKSMGNHYTIDQWNTIQKDNEKEKEKEKEKGEGAGIHNTDIMATLCCCLPFLMYKP